VSENRGEHVQHVILTSVREFAKKGITPTNMTQKPTSSQISHSTANLGDKRIVIRNSYEISSQIWSASESFLQLRKLCTDAHSILALLFADLFLVTFLVQYTFFRRKSR
jgi:hypothetical protein